MSLPPLPETEYLLAIPDRPYDRGYTTNEDAYTADQMLDYARAVAEEFVKDAERLDFIEKRARCDPKMDGQHVWWPTNFNHRLAGPTLRAAIDAAMQGNKG